MCQLKVKVTVKGQILNKQILDIMFCLPCKSYTNGKKSLILFKLANELCRIGSYYILKYEIVKLEYF